jgi:hypothetical protein
MAAPFLTLDAGSGALTSGPGALANGSTASGVGSQTLTAVAGFTLSGSLSGAVTTRLGYTIAQTAFFFVTTFPAGLNQATLSIPVARVNSANFSATTQASGLVCVTGSTGGGPVNGSVTAVPGTTNLLISVTNPGVTLATPILVQLAYRYTCWPT